MQDRPFVSSYNLGYKATVCLRRKALIAVIGIRVELLADATTELASHKSVYSGEHRHLTSVNLYCIIANAFSGRV